MKKSIIIFIAAFIIFSIAACGSHTDNFTIYKKIPEDVENIKDIEYGKAGDHILKMDILKSKHQSQRPQPGIMWIHGGAWETGSKDAFLPQLSAFAENGYICASIDYRLSSESIFPAQIEDCKCAVRFLRANAEKYNLDPDRIGAWGSSAGGHLVTLLGASNGEYALEGSKDNEGYSSSVQAVCSWYGISDLRQLVLPPDDSTSRFLGGPPQQNIREAAEASPIVYISKVSAPFLLMVGDKDPGFTIFDKTGREFCSKLKESGIYSKYKIVRGAGHGFYNVKEFRAVKNFFDSELKNISHGSIN